jgi:hypothetical protein
MSDKIKTREGVKNIKIIDKAENAAKKMKNTYIRTKDEVQQSQQTENDSPSGYATDNATRSAENVVYKTGFQVKKQTGKIIDKVKDTHNIKNKVDSVAEPIKEQAKKHTEQNIRNATQSAKHTTGETIKSVPKGEKTIKQPVKATNKAFKTTLKGTIKKAPKTIKSTERTAKATIKSSQHAAKAAVKTAQATAKASKAAIKSARAAAKVAIRTTKITVKATIAAIKAIIAAVKGLVSLIAAGGWIAVVIIIVICMVAFILFSGFGIFFSNEQPNSQGYTIKQVISELNSEYSNKIEEVQTDNPHDIVVYNSPDGLLPQIKWDEVLAVYAVKTLMDPDNPTEVVTVDDSKKELLRNVLWDMIKISNLVTTEEREFKVVSIDENVNEITSTETVNVKILTILVSQKEYSPDSTTTIYKSCSKP